MACDTVDIRKVIAERYKDILKIVAAILRDPGTQRYLRAAVSAGKRGRHLMEAEDLAHTVIETMLRREGTASAWDPSRGAFSKYVHITVFHVLSHATDAREPEAPLADPDRWSRVPDPAPDGDGLPPALEAILLDEHNAAELRALARHLRADEERGQGRLFDPVDELSLRPPAPALAA